MPAAKRRSAAADRVDGHADDQDFGGDEHRDDRGARHLEPRPPAVEGGTQRLRGVPPRRVGSVGERTSGRVPPGRVLFGNRGHLLGRCLRESSCPSYGAAPRMFRMTALRRYATARAARTKGVSAASALDRAYDRRVGTLGGGSAPPGERGADGRRPGRDDASGQLRRRSRRSSSGTTAPSTTSPTERCTTSRKRATRRKRRSSRPFAACERSSRGRNSRPGSSRSPITPAATGSTGASVTRARSCPSAPTPAPGPEQQAIALDEAARLRAAIDALPEKYRTVITLFHLQGKQYEEIASVLGLPMGTVKTHLFRAKEQLRRLLGGTEVTES